MCGRFNADEETVREIERVIRDADLHIRNMHRGDICPSLPAGILTCRGRQKERSAAVFDLEEMRWGFPQYSGRGLLINARAETALERKTFCDSVRRRRCVIPAKQFYEWDSDKNRVTFFRESGPVLYMAGFFGRFSGEDRFVILTTQANASVSPVHHRMPLVLEEAEIADWICEDAFTEYALHKTPPLLCRRQEYEQQRLVFG